MNTFENWMSACSACNNRKRDKVFEDLPVFAVDLKKAADKATEARALESETRSNQQVARAVTIVEVAYQKGPLTEIQNERLQPLVDFHQTHRMPEKADTPVLIGPGLELLSRDGELITVKGPYGIGAGGANPPNQGTYRCAVCGQSAWNGAWCVASGTIGDD